MMGLQTFAGATLVVLAALVSPAAGDGTMLAVDGEAGNNTFSAIFDAAIGERITAVSSMVSCSLSVDEKQLRGRATCSVPLTSIRVDNDDVKSGHFWQWATNKTAEPEQCRFELEVPSVSLAAVPPMKPVPFETQGTFRLCGRPRDDGGAERIAGTIIYLPADGMDLARTPRTARHDRKAPRTVRIRARIEHFDRERYRVGPRWTAGWLARVQELAPVVATEGTIDVNLFATESVVP